MNQFNFWGVGLQRPLLTQEIFRQTLSPPLKKGWNCLLLSMQKTGVKWAGLFVVVCGGISGFSPYFTIYFCFSLFPPWRDKSYCQWQMATKQKSPQLEIWAANFKGGLNGENFTKTLSAPLIFLQYFFTAKCTCKIFHFLLGKRIIKMARTF